MSGKCAEKKAIAPRWSLDCAREKMRAPRDDGEVPLKRKIYSPGQGEGADFSAVICGNASLFSRHILARIYFAKYEMFRKSGS